MSQSVITRLGDHFSGCIDTACRGSGCSLLLGDQFPSNNIIINIDKVAEKYPASFGKNQNRCDHVVVFGVSGAAEEAEEVFILPVELKSNYIDVKKIKQQIEGGLDFILKHCKKIFGEDFSFSFFPVLASQSVSSKVALDKLEGTTIIRHSKKGKQNRKIKRKRCGDKLSWKDGEPC